MKDSAEDFRSGKDTAGNFGTNEVAVGTERVSAGASFGGSKLEIWDPFPDVRDFLGVSCKASGFVESP